MAYVDLKPTRAKMEESVQVSQYTAIFEHIHDRAHHVDNKEKLSEQISAVAAIKMPAHF